MAYVIGEPCADVLDRACVDECPPGGAGKLGAADADAPFVAALPPREPAQS